MNKTPSLSIIIPYYNEEKNIRPTIDRLLECIKETNAVNTEFILVNNGSTDNSAHIFQDILKENKNFQRLKVVTVERNQGYGYGILCGLREAKGDVLAWTHADMQTDPKDVFDAYWLYMKNCGNHNKDLIIKGKRKNRKFLDAFFTWGMQLFTLSLLNIKLDDINAQPKLFSRNFYTSFVKKTAPYDFSLDLFLLCQAKKHNLNIIDFPVYFSKRLYGQAKGGGNWKTRLRLIRRTITYIYESKNTY
ncbi:glycosyltransferase family 2 protein [bacterium]|nr:glycosyltransferase family 2 protein [bacterium]